MSELAIPEVLSFSSPEHKAQVNCILQGQLDCWTGFPLAQLHELSNGNSLVLVSWFALHKSGLVSAFGINRVPLLAFLQEVQDLYHDNPYHCSMHAADVTQGTYSLMSACGLFEALPPIEALSLLVSAIVHDIDHPGVNNAFLINSDSSLAFVYNDTSVLENHHLVTAFKLMQRSELQWTSVLSKENKNTMRKCMISNILHTDMALHKSGIQELRSLPESCRVQPVALSAWAPEHRQIFNQVLQFSILCCFVVIPSSLNIFSRPCFILLISALACATFRAVSTGVSALLRNSSLREIRSSLKACLSGP